MKESIQLSILVIRDPIEPRDVLARRKWFKYNQFADSCVYTKPAKVSNTLWELEIVRTIYADASTQ